MSIIMGGFDYRDSQSTSSYEEYGDEMDYMQDGPLKRKELDWNTRSLDALWFEDVEEEDSVVRCEADTTYGGVCLTRLSDDNPHTVCPNKNNHTR